MSDTQALNELTAVVNAFEFTDYDGTPLAYCPVPVNTELTLNWLEDLREYLDERGWSLAELVDQLREHRVTGWRR